MELHKNLKELEGLGIRKIPLPFKMKKFKETDYPSHIINLNKRKDKKSRTLSKIINVKNEVILKNAESGNSNVILKEKRIIHKKILSNHQINKINRDIPRVSHNSDIPLKRIKETSSGKLFPSVYSFESNHSNSKKSVRTVKNSKEKKHKIKYKKVILDLQTGINKKKYKIIPIVSHESEKPSMSFEEIDGGKLHSFKRNYSFDFNIKNRLMIKKVKKYNKIPIIPHDSEKPSITFEEINGGKLHSFKRNYSVDFNNKNISKIKEVKKYNEIPVIPHDSEKPSITFEEIDGGKLYSFKRNYSVDYNIKNISKIKEAKKYNEIPIIAHDSEKPSITFEEIDGGKPQFLKNNYSVDYNIKNRLIIKESKKYKIIPIVSHESERPSMSFEEINGGKLYSFIRNYSVDYNMKDRLKIQEVKKYNEIPIIPHDSEKPSITFEEINGGKCCSINATSMINFNNNNLLKNNNKNFYSRVYNDIPIIAHDSEKPTISFEEINDGKYYSKINTSHQNMYYIDNGKDKNDSDIKKCYKTNTKIKQYINIPIILHESEKPIISLEEIDGGKKYSKMKTSFTNYNDKNKLKKYIQIKQYKDIPIILHE